MFDGLEYVYGTNMKQIILTAALLVAAGGASAQAYVGGAIGKSHTNVDTTGTTSSEVSDTGKKIYAGYGFNQNIALEVGYIDFGKAEFTGSVYPYGVLKTDLKSKAAYVAGVFRGEFGAGFGGVARLGLANVKTTATSTQVATSVTGSLSETSGQALFGLGLEYSITKNFKVTGDVEFTNSADIAGESGTLRLLSVGARYAF